MSSWQWWTKTCKQITHTHTEVQWPTSASIKVDWLVLLADDHDYKLCCLAWERERERWRRRAIHTESENYPFRSQTCRLIRSLSQISQGNLCCVRVRPNFRVADAVRTGGGAGGCLKTVLVLLVISMGVTGCWRTSCRIFIAEARSKSTWWQANLSVRSYLYPTHVEPKCQNDWWRWAAAVLVSIDWVEGWSALNSGAFDKQSEYIEIDETLLNASFSSFVFCRCWLLTYKRIRWHGWKSISSAVQSSFSQHFRVALVFFLSCIGRF